MKKKLFILLLSIISVICLAVGLSACGSSKNNATCEHDYGDWITGEQATCTSMGYEYRVCSICNDVDYRFTEASGHIYSSGIVNYDYNTHMLQCTNCNQIITEAHTYVDNICSVCSCHYYSEGLEFSVCSDSNGTVSYAVSKGTCTDSEITIPSVYKGYPVTTIASYAFRDCTFVKNVLIPDSITTIEDCAFRDCTSLTDISIPESVTTICSYAFENCSSLNNIIIPNGVISIGSNVFSGCISLEEITIPDSVTSIGGFAGCISLSSVVIGNGITSIGSSMFKDCTSLTSVVLGSGVTSIGNYAFYGCTSLENITIPSSVITIGTNSVNTASVFENCASLKSVIFDEGSKLEYIGDYSFCYCSSLESITIPNGVTEINTGTFFCCTALTNITIPDSVTYIGTEAFNSCKSLESILIGNGVIEVDNYSFYNCSSLKSITIPNNVTYIGAGAFSSCSSLESITIPFVGFSINSTTASEYTLFGYIFGTLRYDGGTLTSQYCYNYSENNGFIDYYIPTTLTTVTITGGTIFSDAFFNCQNITNVTIGDGVTIISYEAFLNCTSLASVTIGNGVTSIGRQAFGECTSLESVYYNGTVDGWSAITFTGDYSYPTYYGATLYYYSETQPEDDSNYWHYDTEGNIATW